LADSAARLLGVDGGPRFSISAEAVEAVPRNAQANPAFHI
jgi:hypothetical protein